MTSTDALLPPCLSVSYTLHAPSGQVRVEVQPNETTRANIGGSGRQVTGRFVLDRQPRADSGASDWRFDPTVNFELYDKQTQRRDPNYTRYVGQVRKSGDFSIPDVPHGDYQVRMEVQAIGSDGNSSGRIGQKSFILTVEESNATKASPQDVGELLIELDDTLDPGEWAPNFVAETFDFRTTSSPGDETQLTWRLASGSIVKECKENTGRASGTRARLLLFLGIFFKSQPDEYYPSFM